MKVGIIGTRGIPNNYGGFEQLAEYLSVALHTNGHDVYVYNSSLHPYQEEVFNGVKIIKCADYENKIGTFGQFFYDLNCILNARTKKFDAIIQLGYTSSSIWGFLLPKNALIITNMDGLEWKRSKYSYLVKKFLKFAEYLAVKTSNVLVADSLGIQTYLENKYKNKPHFIAYGATVFNDTNVEVLSKFNLRPGAYYLLIARLEPENSIEVIIKGYLKSNTNYPLIIIGGLNKYGEKLKKKYGNNRIVFLGSLYNLNELNNLRFFSQMYFHGHTVGGTNPSLLEAMASRAFVCAHKNIFNQSVLNSNAAYFENEDDITTLINEGVDDHFKVNAIHNNAQTIISSYSWEHITNEYEKLLKLGT